jgi:hypothetical protein
VNSTMPCGAPPPAGKARSLTAARSCVHGSCMHSMSYLLRGSMASQPDCVPMQCPCCIFTYSAASCVCCSMDIASCDQAVHVTYMHPQECHPVPPPTSSSAQHPCRLCQAGESWWARCHHLHPAGQTGPAEHPG